MRKLRKINEDRQNVSKGCVMLYLEPIGKSWQEIIDEVSEEDLYKEGDDFGKETEPHLTVLYGFINPTIARKNVLKDLTKNFPNFTTIQTSAVSLFENEYDVLKFDVNPPKELLELNLRLASSHNVKNDYKEYHPHITIAYLQSGKGKDYINKIDSNLQFKVSKIVWSEGELRFSITKTIIGPVIICRDKSDNLVALEDNFLFTN